MEEEQLQMGSKKWRKDGHERTPKSSEVGFTSSAESIVRRTLSNMFRTLTQELSFAITTTTQLPNNANLDFIRRAVYNLHMQNAYSITRRDPICVGHCPTNQALHQFHPLNLKKKANLDCFFNYTITYGSWL